MAAPPSAPEAQFGTGVREVFFPEGASVSKGAECRAKAIAVFEKFKLPAGLFPLSTITEFGHNETSGLMWMKQPAKTQKDFAAAEIVVHQHRAIHGYIEMQKISKLVGLKLKEFKERNLFISMPYNEIKVTGEQVTLTSEHAAPKSFLAALFQTANG